MKTLKITLVLFLLAVGALTVTGCSGSGATIIDNPGATLPPAPADKEDADYDKEAVALNNQAMELVFKDPKQSLTLLDQAIGKDATYPMLYSNKGTLLLEQGDYAGANVCLERLSELQPHNANAYVVWAYCLHRLDKPRESQQKLRLAIAAGNTKVKNADGQWPRINRAIAVYLIGESELAIRELDQVLEAEPREQMAENLRKEMRELSKDDAWQILHLKGSASKSRPGRGPATKTPKLP